MIRIILLICPILLWSQQHRVNPVYVVPGFMEYPALFSEPTKVLTQAGNRSLLGPFSNIRSFYVNAQYKPDTMGRHTLGLCVHTEKEGDLLRWHRAQGQYSYGIRLSDDLQWKIGAGLGFYNMVIDGTSSTGSLSAWALRSSLGTAIQFRRHQLSVVQQDLGSPRLYQQLRYDTYTQAMLEVIPMQNPFRTLHCFYFARVYQKRIDHDIAWKLSLLGNRIGFGHAWRFGRGNSFFVDGDLVDNAVQKLNLQFVYNSPIFGKLSSDFQSIELRLLFAWK